MKNFNIKKIYSYIFTMYPHKTFNKILSERVKENPKVEKYILKYELMFDIANEAMQAFGISEENNFAIVLSEIKKMYSDFSSTIW